MSDFEGLSEDLIKDYPQAKIVLLDTGLNPDDVILAIISYKLAGVFPMDITVEMLQKGINVMQKGEYWISRELQKKLLERCLDVKENKLPALTQREKEIIELICEGLSNKEIATKLSVSENTVKATLNRIYKKYIHRLGLKSEGEARRKSRLVS